MLFFEVNKTGVDIFGILPKFLKHLLESENLVHVATVSIKYFSLSAKDVIVIAE